MQHLGTFSPLPTFKRRWKRTCGFLHFKSDTFSFLQFSLYPFVLSTGLSHCCFSRFKMFMHHDKQIFFVNKFLLRAKTHTYVYLPGQNTGTGNSSKSPVKPTITMSSVWLVSLLTKKITNILSGIEMLAHNVVQKKKLNK